VRRLILAALVAALAATAPTAAAADAGATGDVCVSTTQDIGTVCASTVDDIAKNKVDCVTQTGEAIRCAWIFGPEPPPIDEHVGTTRDSSCIQVWLGRPGCIGDFIPPID
jgi:hypothetical protein